MKKVCILFVTILFVAFSAVLAQDCNMDENAKKHWNRAEGALNKVDTDDGLYFVIEEYTNALKYTPQCADIYYNIALCYERLAKDNPHLYNTAINNYNKYIELKPNAFDKKDVQGKIIGIQNKIDKLINEATTEEKITYLIENYYNKILENEPNRTDIYFSLALLYEKLAQYNSLFYDDAIDYYNEYLTKTNAPDKEQVQRKIDLIEGEKEVSLQVGMRYKGGYIAYIDPTGRHGLIAAPFDQSEGIQWWDNGKGEICTSVFRGRGSIIERGIGGGKFNTSQIVSELSKYNKDKKYQYAAKICDDLVLNGYDDWYLPNRKELAELYKNRYILPNFHRMCYWSSEENYYCYSAFFLNFDDITDSTLRFLKKQEGLVGTTDADDELVINNSHLYKESKSLYFRVRAVRAF